MILRKKRFDCRKQSKILTKMATVLSHWRNISVNIYTLRHYIANFFVHKYIQVLVLQVVNESTVFVVKEQYVSEMYL